MTSEKNKFDILWNALAFNIYTGTPDPIVLSFLKNHFPYLAKHPKPGNWTVYQQEKFPIPQQGMHSLRINKHPYIKIKHIGARLDIHSQEWKDGPPGIERTRIWIYFDSNIRVKSTYSYIIKEFQKTGAEINRTNSPSYKKTVIKKAGEDQWLSLSLVLKKIPRSNNHSIEILFFDDDGAPW